MIDENRSYAFITDAEGCIYYYNPQNEEIVYCQSLRDGNYSIQTVNC